MFEAPFVTRSARRKVNGSFSHQQPIDMTRSVANCILGLHVAYLTESENPVKSTSQSNPHSSLSFCERLLMADCPKLRPQNRKRQHAESDLSQDDLPSQPSKKLKSIREHHSAPNFPPEFYDSLSKVWLTPRALRELDRRNQLKRTIGGAVSVLPY
jgi:hypothetical protein